MSRKTRTDRRVGKTEVQLGRRIDSGKRVGKTEEQLGKRREPRTLAHMVWQCNLCAHTDSLIGMGEHLLNKHGIQKIETFAGTITERT